MSGEIEQGMGSKIPMLMVANMLYIKPTKKSYKQINMSQYCKYGTVPT